MAIIERELARAPVGEPTTMKAAVVESFTKVITEVRPLEAVNEAIADVEAGRVPARVVFELKGS